MSMWPVQTEGFLDGNGMLIGTVTYDLSDAPDGEMMAGGVNSKGPNSMAIGRQGSCLHWGFAASPTYLTEEAKLVFINAIHYIKQFEGKRAVSFKASVALRSSIDSMMYQVSEQGSAIRKEKTALALVNDQKTKEELKARQAKGEELTSMEKVRLTWAKPSYQKLDPLKRLPAEIQQEFGDDVQKYADYYKENYPYLWSDPDKRYTSVRVDEDAKSLGIANNDLRLLDRCVALLDDPDQQAKARRLLQRYTMQEFETADQWQRWLQANRSRLFFSESSGYKFLIDLNQSGGEDSKPAGQTGAATQIDLKKVAKTVKVDAPTEEEPVKFHCILERVPQDTKAKESGRRYRIVVKARIMDGWHLYASVPEGLPFVETQANFEEAEGIDTEQPWQQTPPMPTVDDPEISIWEHEVVFSKEVSVAGQPEGKLTLNISYQTCNDQMCLPPKTESIEIAWPSK